MTRQLYRVRVRLAFYLCLASANVAAAKDTAKSVSQSIVFKTGAVSYALEGFATKTGMNTSNFAMEYVHHPKKDHGLFFGYRILQAQGSARSEYQAGYTGYRYYPMTLAVPVHALVNNSTISYDFTFKPYVESFGSIGRRLIDTRGETGGLDISSEFYGIGLGGGVQYTPLDYLSLDLNLAFEMMNGYGPVLMSGTNMYVQLGILSHL